MKKKQLILAGFYALGLCVCEAKISYPQQVHIIIDNEDNHIPSGAEAIKLRGKLNCNPGPDDIEAGATATAVYIYFNQAFGNVSISLYNSVGILVYSSVMNISTQQLAVIPITSTTSGIYTIVLENSTGYVEGDFDHN